MFQFCIWSSCLKIETLSKTVGGQDFQRDFVDEKKVCSFRKFLHRNFLDARNRRVADFRFPRSTRFVRGLRRFFVIPGVMCCTKHEQHVFQTLVKVVNVSIINLIHFSNSLGFRFRFYEINDSVVRLRSVRE